MSSLIDFIPVVIVTLPDSDNNPQVFSVYDDWDALRNTIVEAFSQAPSPSGKQDPSTMNGVAIRLEVMDRDHVESLPEWTGW